MFSPDSRRLISCSSSYRKGAESFPGHVSVFDVGSGRQLFTLPKEHSDGSSAAFSLDGRYIGTDAGKAKNAAAIVWDASTCRRIRVLSDASIDNSTESMCFSSDGRLLATIPFQASDRGLLHIWNWSTGKLLRTIRNQHCKIVAIQFAENSRLLISHSRDDQVHLWDTATGKQIARLLGVGLEGDWIAITPEGLFDGTQGARQKLTFRVSGGLNVVPVD